MPLLDEWLIILAPIVATLSVLGLGRFLARASAQRRHARVLDHLGAPLSQATLFHAQEGEVVAFEGTLASADGKPVDVASFHPSGTSTLDEANAYAVTLAPAALLRVELEDGARAILDGELQVISGEIETDHDAKIELAKHPAAASLGELLKNKRTGQARFVKTGDHVRVRGVVTPAPDDDASYRDKTHVLRVTPAPSDVRGTPSVIAIASVSAPKEMRTRSRAGVALVASSAVSCLVAIALVPKLYDAQPYSSAKTTSSPAKNGDPVCRAATLALFDANQWEKAEQSARLCDDAYTSGFARFARGEFTEASNAFARAVAEDPNLAPSLSETEAHLFAHKLDLAAASAHRMVTHFYPGPPTAERADLECVAKKLDEFAARGLKADLGSQYPYRYSCSQALVPRYAAELESEGGMAGGFEHYAPAYDAVGNSFTAAIAPRGRELGRPVGLELRELDRLLLHPGPTRQGALPRAGDPFGKLTLVWESDAGDRYAMLSAFAAELELFYGYAGFPERNADLWPITDRIAASLEATPTKHFTTSRNTEETDSWKRPEYQEQEMLVHEMAIASAAALLSNDTARMNRYANVGDQHSSGVVTQLARMMDPKNPWEKPIEDSHWGDHQALFDATWTGHAKNVVALLKSQHSTGRDTLARIAPRLYDRDVFQEWFEHDYPAPCLTCGASVMLGHLSDRREVARILGGSANAERDRLHEPAKKFVDALTDPDIAWELAELETFFARGK